jgi:Na+/melibiose symporter-like transporter|tara:strand:+ start:25151 stop:26488 length:1338 start_codon:yes stop_codon:yes gene_type:complete
MQKSSNGQVFLYALPGIAIAFINLPAAIILPTFYVEHTAATLTGIGVVNLLRWWFDAATDPIVGYLGDRTTTRWGRRKPWLVMGAIVSSVSIFHLFRPPADAGSFYYALWLCGVYLGFTLFTIAHQAWGSELAVSYNDRSRISTTYSVMSVIGSLLFWALPLMLAPFTGTSEIGPQVINGIAWIFIVLMPLSALLAISFVPVGIDLSKQAPQSLRKTVSDLKFNRPLWRFVLAQAVWGIGQGMYLSVIFVFMRDYLQLGAKFPLLMIMFFLVQTLSMPVWARLMGRYGKHRCWAFSWAAFSLAQPAVFLLEPGIEAFLPLMLMVIVTAFINSASYIAPMALLGDISDYGTLKSGSNNTGNYFAVQTLLQKGTMGMGAGFAFPLLALFGYELGADNQGMALWGLHTTYIIIPAVTSVIAAAILWNFPIDARRHAIIRKRLEQLALR